MYLLRLTHAHELQIMLLGSETLTCALQALRKPQNCMASSCPTACFQTGDTSLVLPHGQQTDLMQTQWLACQGVVG